MQVIPLTAAPQGFGRTSRRDSWWSTPLVVFTVFSPLSSTPRGQRFKTHTTNSGLILSPFYSPVLWGDSSHAWFGPQPAWWPGVLPFSPALVDSSVPWPVPIHVLLLPWRLLQGVLGGSAELRRRRTAQGYLGENSFPLILQNVHRYFFYFAVIFIFILSYDVWLALWFTNPVTLRKQFGIGVGTILLLVNVILLASYTFGCHSGRHCSVVTWMKCPSRR